MNIQEKFLIATKNAMFWNFSSHDITETLKDLKHNFQDARKNGSSDNEIINEYGSPKNVAESLKDEISGQKQKNAVYRRKMTLLILCIIAIFVSVFTLPVKLSSCTIILIASVFIWFFSGSNLMIGICDNSTADKTIFAFMQTGILLLVILLHIVSFKIIPTLVNTSQILFFEKYFMPSAYLLIAILFVFTSYSLFKLTIGKTSMFFITMQNVSLISSLFAYIEHLKNADTLIIAAKSYTFNAYFICLLTMIPFLIYTYIKSKNNY